MKRSFLLVTVLLLTIFGFAYEYTNDKYCVYEINVGDQTASVVNFYSDASIVVIPASFVYKGDSYKVIKLGYKDFKTRVREDWSGNTVWESYGKYSYEDYDENRSCIVELILPTTLKSIGDYAFKGMTRLKRITIPSSVETYYSRYSDFMDWFSGNSRLESITFEGMLCYSEMQNWENPKICLHETSRPSYVLDSLKNKLSSSKCPKLQTIEVVPLREYMFYKDKLDKSYASYSKRLSDTVSVYKTRLAHHPYYMEDNYFSKIAIQKPILTSTKAKENYATQSTALRKEYNRQLTLCREKYKNLWDNMEQNCKQKSLEIYADRYCALHPDFSAQIDTLLKDYKCEYTKQILALAVLNNYQLEERCQDKLWGKYSYLYRNKEMFLAQYNLSSDIKREIAKREKIYNTLKNQIRDTHIPTKGFYDLDNQKHPNITKDFRHNYDEMVKNEIPVSVLIIEKDPKALKEFEKNGQYFDSPDEFFAAYIRSNYSNILKSKKKSKK